MVSLQNRHQSTASGGVVRGGRGHRHRNLTPVADDLSPVAQAHLVIEVLDGLVFEFEPALPFEARVFVERRLGVMAADAVIDLPGDELGMIAQGLGHLLDDALGVIPVGVAVQADGAARAFVLDQAVLVEGQNLRMLLRQPDRRRGGGRAEHHLDVVFAHDVHHAAQPGEIIFAVLASRTCPRKIRRCGRR